MTKHGVEHYYIELIENFPCNNIEELRKKEGEYIRELGTLNKIISGRTNQEYRKEHNAEIKEKKKEYHEKNRERHLELMRLYREENKEKIKERKKLHYETNKDRILEKQRTKYTCPTCGSEIVLYTKLRHEKNIKASKRIVFSII
jgi:predicted RNA-binding Zn-ribbon protein involved in translation (DUF1610 family)